MSNRETLQPLFFGVQNVFQRDFSHGFADFFVQPGPHFARRTIVRFRAERFVDHAFDDGNRSLHGFDDVQQSDFLGLFQQPQAALRPAQGFDESRFVQRQNQAADVFFGNLLGFGDPAKSASRNVLWSIFSSRFSFQSVSLYNTKTAEIKPEINTTETVDNRAERV